MRILSILAVTVAAVAVGSLPQQAASAQDYTAGYGFGLGFDIGRQNADFSGHGSRRHCQQYGNFGPTPRYEDLPYFAKFPPVYYSGIVHRAYGVSPFAVPPGIPPVEQFVPAPVTISNPYYANPEVVPASNEAEPQNGDSSNGKQTSRQSNWIENTYLHTPPEVAVGR